MTKKTEKEINLKSLRIKNVITFREENKFQPWTTQYSPTYLCSCAIKQVYLTIQFYKLYPKI